MAKLGADRIWHQLLNPTQNLVAHSQIRQYLCGFHLIWALGAGGGGGLPRDGYTTCSCSFSLCAAQKLKFPKLIFFDIVATQNDHVFSIGPTFFRYPPPPKTPPVSKSPKSRVSQGTALLRIDPVQGGLAKGNRIPSQRLLDQGQAGVYRGKRHIPPHFGLFGPIRVPYPKGLNC